MRADDAAAGRGDTSSPVAVVPGARSVVRAMVRPVLRTWLRLEVVDQYRVPAHGPVLIASTHASHADSIALGAGLDRPVFFLGDERLTRWPVLGPCLPRLGMVPLRRGEGDLAALGHLADLLADGHAVVVYPEGSRSRDGRIYQPRSGTARLAARTAVPVVPAAVAGTFEVWPTDARPRLRGGKVRIRFGPPLAPPDATPRSRRAFNRRLQAVLVELSGKPRADEFAAIRGGAEA